MKKQRNELEELEGKRKKLEENHPSCKEGIGLKSKFSFFSLLLLWITLSIIFGVVLLSFNLLYQQINIYLLILFWFFISFFINGAYRNKKEFKEWIFDDFLWVGFGIIIFSFIVGSLEALVSLTFFYSIYSDYRLRKRKKKWEKLTSKINHIRSLKVHKQKLKFEKSQKEKGLELFENRWVDKKEISKLKEIKLGVDKNFQNYSPYEFEKLIAKLFKAMGYETRVTQASNDYGIDVVAKKCHETLAIQCKRYRSGNPVGNNDVQKLLGAMQHRNIRANHSVIITTSHFTVQAKEQAKECSIELWDGHELKKMVKKYLMEI